MWQQSGGDLAAEMQKNKLTHDRLSSPIWLLLFNQISQRQIWGPNEPFSLSGKSFVDKQCFKIIMGIERFSHLEFHIALLVAEDKFSNEIDKKVLFTKKIDFGSEDKTARFG